MATSRPVVAPANARLPVRGGSDPDPSGSSRTRVWDPHHPAFHLFARGQSPHVLVVDGSRIYEIDSDSAERLEKGALAGPPGSRVSVQGGDSALAELGLVATRPHIEAEPPQAFPLRSLSLAVAQKCNLGCTYCYAQEGDFGGVERSMTFEVARASIERLLETTSAGEKVNLTFLGGEPLVNRRVLRRATQLAVEAAQSRGIDLGLSITTNGTLLSPEDGEFFEHHGFAVTVSLDGIGSTHDRLRPFKSGRGSYSAVVERVRPLLARQRRMQVSARVTVTPANLMLRETLDELIGLGFHSVGFSPMLSSPTGHEEMAAPDLELMLDQMISCGRELERRVEAGERYPFTNLMTALQEIHRGTHRPYPCGAGAGYMGVSAGGDLFACHRFVNDEAGAMGDLETGVDPSKQAAWLAERHVHTQEPCASCWARYLCGGGCHHEVINRGRPACDYIRGWLHYCLEAYVRLLERCPELFRAAACSLPIRP